MLITHVKSVTIADGTNTNIVRPGDWNSVHRGALTIVGNTSNAATWTGSALQMSGGPNVTLAISGNSLKIEGGAGAGGGAAISAGTESVSTGTVVFSNSNGVTFGMSGSSRITASHNGLTTAAASDHSHGNPTLALTNLTGTTASNSAGLTLSLSAAVGGGADGVNILAAGTQTANTTGTVVFLGSNGITFGMSGSTRITASHDGLTTAAQSNHSHGNPTLALTNLTGTTASNSGGFTLSLSAATVGGADGVNIIAAGTQTANTTGTVEFFGSNGITFGMSGSSRVTASHNGVTTARASNDAIGLNTALTAGPLAWTVNSGGLSLNAGSAAGTTTGFAGNSISGSMTHNTAGLNMSLNHPAWLVTAALSDHSHGNPALYLTNLTGTTASNSAGFTLSLSAGVGGAGDGVNILAAGTQTANTTGTVVFSNSNGITFGMTNNSIVTASHNGLTTAAASDHSHGNPTLNLTNLSGTTASNSAGLTLSLSAAAPGGGAAVTVSGTKPFPYGAEVIVGTLGNRSLNFHHLDVPIYVAIDRIANPIYVVMSTASTATVSVTSILALYTVSNNSTLNRLTSWSGSFSINHSGTQNSASNTGVRYWTFGLGESYTMTPGNYVVGQWSSTTYSSQAAVTISNFVMSQINSVLSGYIGSASTNIGPWMPWQGTYSNSTVAMPASLHITDIRGGNAVAGRPVSWYASYGTPL